MKRSKIIILFALVAVLLVSCNKGTKNGEGQGDGNGVKTENATTEYTVPDLSEKNFDSTLQQQLIKEGYQLSVKTEYHDTVPVGCIISQTPAGNTVAREKGISLKLTISAGKKEETTSQALDDKEITDNGVPETNISQAGIKYTAPSWIISPRNTHEEIFTFAKTGYSICEKNGVYSVIDMNGRVVVGGYGDLFYCPEHGLSSKEVSEKKQLTEDITLSADCGYRTADVSRNIYVYDDSRSRVYLTGYSEGTFRIADITDTDFFKSNGQYIAVLYNCDADILMYDGIGMKSLEEIFSAEHTEMKYGVVDSNLVTITEFVYDEISDGNDCYIVKQDEKHGYIGTDGRIYYPCIFEEANTAYKGAAWVKYNGKWGTVAF
ncbi:MAG: WG repeat-containing protein [Clostridia bacterium]|nr:WG repeat-containing protein [Clostridia bacterium]